MVILNALYIMGENPILSEPDSKHVEKSLKNLNFSLSKTYS